MSLGHVVSWALWAAVAALLVGGALVGSLYLGLVGCATSAAAATSTIRGYFCSHNRMVRAAYDIGRGDRVRSVQ